MDFYSQSGDIFLLKLPRQMSLDECSLQMMSVIAMISFAKKSAAQKDSAGRKDDRKGLKERT